MYAARLKASQDVVVHISHFAARRGVAFIAPALRSFPTVGRGAMNATEPRSFGYH